MQYKNRVLEMVRHYLLMNHPSSEVDSKLGGWNYAEKKDDRNQVIEQSLLDIRWSLSIMDDFMKGKITADEMRDRLSVVVK